jgi:hypothetical protein
MFAGSLEDRSGHGENIGRFYPGSLDLYFLGDSGLVYDSGTADRDSGIPAKRPRIRGTQALFAGSLAREMAAPAGVKPRLRLGR